jgi:hypothetical protein
MSQASHSQLLHTWPVYISLLFLGFFPGLLIMAANQEKPKPIPALLEYDLMILRVPARADVSQIPDFADWNNASIGKSLHEQGWRILSEPKLMSAYPCEASYFVGKIPGFEKQAGTGSDFIISFLTQVQGASLETQFDFFSDGDEFSQTHWILHESGKTHLHPLTSSTPNDTYRYFLLLKVTAHENFQAATPAIAPTGGTTAP